MDLYGKMIFEETFSNKTRTGPLWRDRRLPCRTVYNLGVEMPDLYLMLVECQARSMDQALQNEARINLEEFRRHRMSQEAAVIPADITSQEKLIRFVVEERLREYMMTGIRWFDMRRLWNDPLSRLEG
ncbi:MAG: RagB/SusD family nutrient uptake outer membrane protein [Butyricimonas faecihominis]